MTKQVEILNDPNYIPVLDHGFVGLQETMGSDATIVAAARVSYGAGTKSVNEDRGLIRYLVSHKHTSPIEMCEVRLHIRLPIFIMRQLVRHRTASLNEYSGRYSIMSDEYYLPAADDLKPQSKDNKQGRAGDFDDETKDGIQWLIQSSYDSSHATYDALVKAHDDHVDPSRVIYDAYDANDPLLSHDFPGLARELARIVQPVSAYTEVIFKQDLHNLLHMLKLRRDGHAQKEIRDYADAIYTLIKPKFPLTVEAWEDYSWGATSVSAMETSLMKTLLSAPEGAQARLTALIAELGDVRKLALAFGMNAREIVAFAKQWDLTLPA